MNEAPGGGWNDRNDFSGGNNKFPQQSNNYHHGGNNNFNNNGYNDRPHFSQYQYPSSGSSNNVHPPSHPDNGDGQWVLLSTNRGYSKSRQRSIKLDASLVNAADVTPVKGKRKEERVPAVTSKRQVRGGWRGFRDLNWLSVSFILSSFRKEGFESSL